MKDVIGIMKGVLFDLDGVVTDTATYHFSAWSQLVKRWNLALHCQKNIEEQHEGVQ